MVFPLIETKRLQLVELTQQHADRIFEILTENEVIRYYGMDKLAGRLEAEELISSFHTYYQIRQGIRWGIVLKETGEFIGSIGLNNMKLRLKRSEIGYELHPDHWKRGYISEAMAGVLSYAFEELGIFRMAAITFPQNEKSNGLLLKMGFELEGTLRGYLFQGEKSHDALVFSLLRTDWALMKNKEEELEES
ncbi:GNAT family N-acetyltransferase [Planomicrobium sp. YIM 101495]|nr:GNAT family N-acetyltransferase [Planomicrobium sp. YIM 101495]MTD31134.1 GNAT family N-acetyltransferase [Planomicrobium sp. YIM 101495]